jgi:hypothetical protein
MADERRDPDTVPVEVEWAVAEETVTSLATNMVIQHGPGIFVLNFFEMQLPINTQDDVGAPPKLVAKCVARVGVPAPSMRSFVQAIEDNVAKYERRFGPLTEAESSPEGATEP